MSAKKRQTFEKMNRERAVRERRERKQEKKEQRKLAAQAVTTTDGPQVTPSVATPDQLN